MATVEELNETFEMQLAETTKERQEHATAADMYALLVAVDQLEAAYVSDRVRPEEYRAACADLLNKVRVQQETLRGVGLPADIASFLSSVGARLPRAENRVREGVPAAAPVAPLLAIVSETSTFFQGVIQNLQLALAGRADADQVRPDVEELVERLNRNSWLPHTWEGKAALVEWLRRLRSMRAADEVPQADVRQLCADVQSAQVAYVNECARSERERGGR